MSSVKMDSLLQQYTEGDLVPFGFAYQYIEEIGRQLLSPVDTLSAIKRIPPQRLAPFFEHVFYENEQSSMYMFLTETPRSREYQEGMPLVRAAINHIGPPRFGDYLFIRKKQLLKELERHRNELSVQSTTQKIKAIERLEEFYPPSDFSEIMKDENEDT